MAERRGTDDVDPTAGSPSSADANGGMAADAVIAPAVGSEPPALPPEEVEPPPLPTAEVPPPLPVLADRAIPVRGGSEVEFRLDDPSATPPAELPPTLDEAAPPSDTDEPASAWGSAIDSLAATGAGPAGGPPPIPTPVAPPPVPVPPPVAPAAGPAPHVAGPPAPPAPPPPAPPAPPTPEPAPLVPEPAALVPEPAPLVPEPPPLVAKPDLQAPVAAAPAPLVDERAPLVAETFTPPMPVLVDPSAPVPEQSRGPIGMGLEEPGVGGAAPVVVPAPIDPAPLAPGGPLPSTLGDARDIDELPSGVFSGSARFAGYHSPVQDGSYEVPDRATVPDALGVLGRLERTDEYRQSELVAQLQAQVSAAAPSPVAAGLPEDFGSGTPVVPANIPPAGAAPALAAPRGPSAQDTAPAGPGLISVFLVSALAVFTAAGIAWLVLSSPRFAPEEGPAEGLVARPTAESPEVVPTDAPVEHAQTWGVLRVRSNLKAVVYVDGVQIGMTPQDHRIDAGRHEVAALVPGQPATRQARTVEVRGDGSPVEVLFEY